MSGLAHRRAAAGCVEVRLGSAWVVVGSAELRTFCLAALADLDPAAAAAARAERVPAGGRRYGELTNQIRAILADGRERSSAEIGAAMGLTSARLSTVLCQLRDKGQVLACDLSGARMWRLYKATRLEAAE